MTNNILKQIKLLYVEDDDSIRGILSKGLKRRVKEIEVAIDGVDGLDKYKSFQPDIIVTDIKMPRMSGLQMSEEIRSLDKSIPIIITSAHGEADTLIESIKIGVNGYILKPIDTEKLFEMIALYAKSRVLENELITKNKQLSLQSKNAALGEMIGNIAHQWRQPLSIISTSASTIQLNHDLGIVDEEGTTKYLEKIISTTQYLSKTIDYFRDIIIPNSEQKDVFNISEVVNNAIVNNSTKIKKNNIEIIKNFDINLTLNSYPNLFLQSITNILKNSIEELADLEICDKLDSTYCYEKKYIFIDIASDLDNNFIINIKDNAGGIAEDIIDSIFDPYVTTKHKSVGKGMGLHTSLIMVQNGMNGKIEVKNSEFEYKDIKYKGANFSIILQNLQR